MRRIAAAIAVFILSTGMALAQMITEDEVEAARQQYLAGNYEAAFEVLVPAAEQGDMVAQNIVGVAHQYGEFLPIDAKSAVAWFTASGNQGFGAAWHNLGYLYEVGMPGLQPDDFKARAYYERAVAVDYNLSRANLGTMLRDGRGGKVDYAGAIALYEAGIAGGDGTAMDAMGWLYLNGIGVQADDVEARRYYQMASDNGYAQGTGNLAFMTEMGRGGPKNLKLARQLYLQAIEGGHVHSAINLAWMMTENPQAFPDPVEALAWCYWAADNAEAGSAVEYATSCDEIAAPHNDTIRQQAVERASQL
jgi:TPR repeat protein